MSTLATYLIPTVIVQPPVQKRSWIEDDGTEIFLCSGCGEWQPWFVGDRCPDCIQCAKNEGELI